MRILHRTPPTFSQGVQESFPLILTEAILPVHDVGIKLHLSCLPDDLVHVSGFGGEDIDVLELDLVSQVDV